MGNLSFLAYGTLKFGVNVTCGDIDGDGFDEILTGAGRARSLARTSGAGTSTAAP